MVQDFPVAVPRLADAWRGPGIQVNRVCFDMN
ncbi:hypothetical protein METH_16740 [Leisingera methylohalidivorans DSM 14336]|uniref:Uncharacterized protein n=1 Tax=Leisingera methylohalidivorans DSM 14336 TaxID=999552 RepID=V9VZ42_9RHOB|nr:hypothetical protein METH_16740 [Leisingera methylohalidivorans DSM 14336]